MSRVERIGDATLYLGDCRDILPTLGPVDACITDPPYGCGKADWDDVFPQSWYAAAKAVADRVAIITGSAGLTDSVHLVGGDFVDVIAARNLNGMTRGPIGFGNWLGVVLAGAKPRMGVNFFEFTVAGDMPDHPSPKPVDFMYKLVGRLTDEGETVLDPFLGSGTTGVACANLGRRFIGVELHEPYFDIACRRIERVYRQPRLFADPAPRSEQMGLLT